MTCRSSPLFFDSLSFYMQYLGRHDEGIPDKTPSLQDPPRDVPGHLSFFFEILSVFAYLAPLRATHRLKYVCCMYLAWLCLWLVLTFICIGHLWSVSRMSRWCVYHSTTSEFMWGWAMPSLSNSRTGSTAQIYGNEWGANPGRYIIKSTASSGTRTLDARPQQSDALPLRYASTFVSSIRVAFDFLVDRP